MPALSHGCRLPVSFILGPLACTAVVKHDGPAGNGMRVVERYRISGGPQARRRIDECIRSERVLRVAHLGHGDEIDRGLLPTFGEATVPEREVAQRLYLPDAILAHVVVLVDAALPPGAL